MARVSLPESRLRARRRKRRFIAAGIWTVIGAALVGGVAWGSHAPFLQISDVRISGAQTIATSAVADFVRQEIAGSYYYIFAKDNILLYPRHGIEADLLVHFPELKSAEVHAGNFHTVAVDVVERQPIALYCGDPAASSTGCMLMDETGIAYAPAQNGADSSYVSYQGTATTSGPALQYLTPAAFQALAALAGTLMQTATSTGALRTIVVDANGDARAYFQNDFLLMFNTKDQGGDVYERFVLALKSDPFANHKLDDFEYLDLRFGDKLYYKLK